MEDESTDGNNIPKGKIGNDYYHFEYTCLHNQRMSLVRIIHLWYGASIPTSAVVFYKIFTSGFFIGGKIFFVPLFAIAVLVAGLLICRQIDQGIIRLYPRIITLELMLDFYFFRNYLKGLPKLQGKETDKGFIFVRQCESSQNLKNKKKLWEEVQSKFKPEYFPFHKRGHIVFIGFSCFLGFVYFVLTILKCIQ